MKSLIFLVVMIIINNSQAKAQDYHNITNSNLIWNYLEIDESYSPEHLETTWFTYSLNFQGDTVIDGEEYFKIFKSTEMPENWVKFAYLREDADGKVFFRKDNEDEEKIMYNFSLIAGETYSIYSFYGNMHRFIVDSVADTTLQNSEIRKTLYISYIDDDNNAYFNDVWIEGIGSTFGLLLYEYYHNWIGNYTKRELLCLHNNDVQLIKNQDYETCWEVNNNTLTPSKEAEVMQVNPNPVNSISYVNNIPHNSKVEIFDEMGKKVLSKRVHNTFKINKNDFTKGFYILTIKNGNGYINFIKFTIQ